MPGYTHLQRAQPVPSATTCSPGWRCSIATGRASPPRRRRPRQSPLGAGALAGSTLGLPRLRRTRCGTRSTPSPTATSRSTTSTRPPSSSPHLSRIGEELCLWATAEFGFARLPESAATGSSMMPQKLNPDVAELARGKAGTAIGRLTGLLATVKGLPLAYDRDLQEDKPPVFATRRDVAARAARSDRARQRARARPRAACRGSCRSAAAGDRRGGGPRAGGHAVPRRARAGCRKRPRRVLRAAAREPAAACGPGPGGVHEAIRAPRASGSWTCDAAPVGGVSGSTSTSEVPDEAPRPRRRSPARACRPRGRHRPSRRGRRRGSARDRPDGDRHRCRARFARHPTGRRCRSASRRQRPTAKAALAANAARDAAPARRASRRRRRRAPDAERLGLAPFGPSRVESTGTRPRTR